MILVFHFEYHYSLQDERILMKNRSYPE